MVEIKGLVPWMHEHKIHLEVVYICSEANLADVPVSEEVEDRLGSQIMTRSKWSKQSCGTDDVVTRAKRSEESCCVDERIL